MGSRVGTGVSPGESRARTGAAVGPGSISGLSRKDANEVISRAERLRGDTLTPETVNIAANSLGINRDRPGMKSFALPPSEAIKNIRPDAVDLFIEMQNQLGLLKPDQPPSMSVPQLPNTGVPGAEYNNLPNTNPFELTEMPKINLPEAPPGTSLEELTGFNPSDGSYPKKEVPPNAGVIPSGLAGILAILKQQGLL